MSHLISENQKAKLLSIFNEFDKVFPRYLYFYFFIFIIYLFFFVNFLFGFSFFGLIVQHFINYTKMQKRNGAVSTEAMSHLVKSFGVSMTSFEIQDMLGEISCNNGGKEGDVSFEVVHLSCYPYFNKALTIFALQYRVLNSDGFIFCKPIFN